MSPAGRRVLVFAILFAAVGMGDSLIGRAQQTPVPPDVLTALLIEVRGLRAAMEQMASAGPRVQLALGRVQLQEQRIGNQIRRLDTVRANLVLAQKEFQPLDKRMKGWLAAGERDDTDLATRRLHEEEFKELKAEWSRVSADVQRLFAEEAMLVQDIAAEQNRWADFNQRLEELEVALGRR